MKILNCKLHSIYLFFSLWFKATQIPSLGFFHDIHKFLLYKVEELHQVGS